MSQNFNGLHEAVATFKGNVNVGTFVTFLSNGVVAEAEADKDIIGYCVSRRKDLAGVQLRGAVTVGYTGTAPTLGYCNLLTATSTSVKVSSSGKTFLVLEVDTTKKSVTILL
jgi:hypothetical protein